MILKVARIILLHLFLIFVFGNCDPNTNFKESNLIRDESGKVIEGTLIQHKSDGTLFSERTYKNGKLHGISKTFYPDGKLRTAVNYNLGIKHGIALKFYQNEIVYQEYNYNYGKLDGPQKKYYENGKLMSVIKYKNDFPGIGLKEYITSGQVKKKYPSIIIEAQDQTLINSTYVLKIRLSDGNTSVQYFRGKLDEGGFMNSSLERLVNIDNGVLEMYYNVPPGHFLMEEINIVAKVTTKLRNIYIVTKKHNLSIENRG